MRVEPAARLICLLAIGASASLLAGYAIAQAVADDMLAAPHYHQPAPRHRAIAQEPASDFMRALERGTRLRREEQRQPSGSSRL